MGITEVEPKTRSRAYRASSLRSRVRWDSVNEGGLWQAIKRSRLRRRQTQPPLFLTGTENHKGYSGDCRFTRVYVKLNGNWVTVALQATLIQQAVSDCNLSYGQVTSVSNPKLAMGQDYMQGFRTTSWFGDQNDCDVSEARTFTRGDDDDGILVCVEPLYFMSTDGGISHGHFRSRNREARNYTTR